MLVKIFSLSLYNVQILSYFFRLKKIEHQWQSVSQQYRIYISKYLLFKDWYQNTAEGLKRTIDNIEPKESAIVEILNFQKENFEWNQDPVHGTGTSRSFKLRTQTVFRQSVPYVGYWQLNIHFITSKFFVRQFWKIKGHSKGAPFLTVASLVLGPWYEWT